MFPRLILSTKELCLTNGQLERTRRMGDDFVEETRSRNEDMNRINSKRKHKKIDGDQKKISKLEVDFYICTHTPQSLICCLSLQGTN